MEDLKEKLPMVIAVIVAIVICVTGLYFFENYKSIYYTQIDNTKIEKVSSSDNMKYEYTLTAYDEKGKEKEVTFKTNRELREDAYLKLEVMLTRGVLNWEEVQFEEMPKEVREKYS